MKRRTFFQLSAAGTAAAFTKIGCTDSKRSSGIDKTVFADGNTLAGSTLEQLHAQYRHYLFDDFLPFMEKYVIDHEYGGFMCNTDRDGTNITGNKSAWYEGRGIWVYSFLYNNISKEQKYLDIAKKSVDFILKNEPDGDTMFPGGFSREGEPITRPNLIEVWPVPEWDIYGDLFIANGLAEYSKACGEESYWNKAKQIMLKCIRIYDRSDYPYQVTYGPEAPPMKGLRILGHWMVFLRMSTQMLEHKSDPEIEEVAARCIDSIMNYHFNPGFELLNEVLNHDMTLPENAFSQFVYTGHAIETLWMILFEAARQKDIKLFELAAGRFKRHVEVAWDDIYGGVFRGLIDVDKNIWRLDKVLWAQEEVLIGSLFIIEHTGAQWAKEIFEKMYPYVINKYPLQQYGYSLWNNSADRKVTFEAHTTRVGNFHHPRHLMLNLLSIERMISRKGGITGLFS